MDWSDGEAAAEAKRGNVQAFRVLVDRHSRPVFRLAFRMTGNEQDAEDLVQETFLRAYRQLPRFDSRAAFGTWVYRICTNCALDLLRARKARREVDGSESSDDWLEQTAAREPSPERLTQSGQIGELLAPALRQLTAMERMAFTLRHFEGCDIAHIAQALGVQENAAKHSVFRAVQKLRRVLEPAWSSTR